MLNLILNRWIDRLVERIVREQERHARPRWPGEWMPHLLVNSNLGYRRIGDTLTFYAATSLQTGAANDADSVPGYRIYEEETGTPIVSGASMALLDSANTDGFYSEQITLDQATGYEFEKDYAIRITAAISSITSHALYSFRIGPEGAVDSANAQAGAAGTITLKSGASATDDLYNGMLVVIIGGTGAGQARTITDYVGSTKVASVEPNWITNPSSSSIYALYHSGRANVGQWLGVTPNALVSGRVDASVGAMANDVITAAAIATAAIDADAIAPDAIGSSELATSAVDEIVDAVWDELASGHLTSGSFGQRLNLTRANTAAAGAATTITLDAGASATDDFYNGQIIYITAGTGAGQARTISDYVGSTKVATIDPAWATNPSGTSVFVIFPGPTSLTGSVAGSVASVTGNVGGNVVGSVGSVTGNVGGNVVGSVGSVVGNVGGNVNGNVVGSVGSVVGNVGGNVVGSVGSVVGNVGGNVVGSVGSIAAGGITASSFAADSITAAAIAADAIGSSELATSAVDEIVDAVWDEATSGHATIGTFGQRLYGIRASTATGGAATTITLDAGASATNDFYNGALVAITGGTGAGQARTITAYNGTTKVATVNPAWTTNPSGTSQFVIIPQGASSDAASVAAAVWDATRASHTTAGTFGEGVASVQGDVTGDVLGNVRQSVLGDVQGNLFGSVLTDVVGNVQGSVLGNVNGSVGSVTGNVGGNLVGNVNGNVVGSVGSVTGNVGGNVNGSVGSVAAGGITASSFAANAIDSAALASSAVDEIVDQTWDEILAGHLAAGSTGAALAAASTGGTADWTAGERAQIRQALGVTGAVAATTGAGTLELASAAIQADTDNLQTRVPTTLHPDGRMRSHVEACDPPCQGGGGGGGGGSTADTFEGVPL